MTLGKKHLQKKILAFALGSSALALTLSFDVVRANPDFDETVTERSMGASVSVPSDLTMSFASTKVGEYKAFENDFQKKQNTLSNHQEELELMKSRLSEVEKELKEKGGNKYTGFHDKYRFDQYGDKALIRQLLEGDNGAEMVSDYARLCASIYLFANDKELSEQNKGTMRAKEEQAKTWEVMLEEVVKLEKQVTSKKITDPIDLQKAVNHLLTLDTVSELPGETLESRLLYIAAVKGAIRDKIDNLMNIDTSEDNVHAKKLESLDLFRRGDFQGFRVKSVFYRSGKEFSGALLVHEAKNEVVLAVAGSKSGMDWVNNFQFWGGMSDAELGFAQGLNVHKGVLNLAKQGLRSFVPALDKYLQECQDQGKAAPTITVTGHSLGGGMAQVLANHVKTVSVKGHGYADADVRCLSMASPRVFDKESAETFENNMGKGNIVRVWNKYDLVPAIVLGTFNSKHAGVDICMEQNFFSKNWYVPFSTHSMGLYYDVAKKSMDRLSAEAKEMNGLYIEKNALSSKIKEKASLVKAAENERNAAQKAREAHVGEHADTLIEKADKKLTALQGTKAELSALVQTLEQTLVQKAAELKSGSLKRSEKKAVEVTIKSLNEELKAKQKELSKVNKSIEKTEWTIAGYESDEEASGSDVESILDQLGLNQKVEAPKKSWSLFSPSTWF
jgi:hypothetical protein